MCPTLRSWLLACCAALAPVGAAPAQDAGPVASSVHAAVERNDPAALQSALRPPAAPNESAGGYTPLGLAARLGRGPMIPLLLAAGADVNAGGDHGSPLHLAVGSGHGDVLRALLDAGADPDARDGRGARPLHRAALQGARGAARDLLAAGASVTARDEGGRTPLMLAAARGEEAVVELLLASRADPSTRDRAGRTAADLARAAGHAGLPALLVREKPRPAGRPVAPGTDLTRLTVEARDGAVLLLQPGAYTGTIVAQGKSLTVHGDPGGRTVLGTADNSMAVLVEKKGRVALHGLTFRPGGKARYAVFAKDGSATIEDCRFEAYQDVAVYGEAATLSVVRSAFSDFAKPAVVAVKGSSVRCFQDTFERGGGEAVSVRQGGDVYVVCSRFTDTRRGVFLKQAAHAVICSNRYTHAKGGEVGMYVESTGRTLLARNTVLGAEYGLTVIGKVEEPVVLAGNVAVGGKTPITLRVGSEPGTPGVLATGNLAVAPGQSAVVLDGTPAAVLTRNTAIGATFVVALMNGSAARMEENICLAAEIALHWQKSDAARSTLLRTLRVGRLSHDGPPPAQDRTTRLAAAVQERPGLAALAVGTAARALERARTASGDDPQPLGDALAAVAAWRDAVGAAGRRLARVRFEVTDRLGVRHAVEADAYEALADRPGVVAFSARAFRGPEAFRKELAGGDHPVAAHLRALVPEAARDLAAPASSPGAQLAAVLNRLLATDKVWNETAFGSVALRPATKRLLGKRKKSAEDWRVLNRLLLEDAFPRHVATHRPLAPFVEGGDAFLPPGDYWLVPEPRHLRARRVTLGPGERTTVSVTRADSLWLPVDQQGNRVQKDDGRGGKVVELEHPGAPPRYVLVALKDARSMRRAVARRRSNGLGPVAMPRWDTAAADRAAALEAARGALDRLRAIAADDEAHQERRFARTAAGRIFSALGTADDAARLLRHCSALPEKAQAAACYTWIPVVAHVEARLGRLASGALARSLEDAPPDVALHAAAWLHRYGLDVGDPVLVAALNDPDRTRSVHVAVNALLDVADPAVLEGMRRQLRRAVESERTREDGRLWVPSNVLLYLLAFGERSDWKALTALPLQPHAASGLVLAAADPRPLAELVTFDGAQVQMVPELWALPAGERRSYAKALQAIAYRQGVRALYQHEDGVSFLLPSRGAAKRYFANNSFALWASWLSHIRDLEEYVAQMAENAWPAAYSFDGQLDHVDPEALAAALAEQAKTKPVPAGELIRLAALTTVRAGIVGDADDFDSGVERRCYAVRHDADSAGALVGVCEVRPVLKGRTLTIRMALRQGVHPHVTNFITAHDSFSNYLIHPYTIDGNRKLLHEVWLTRGGERIPLEPVEGGGAPFVYAAGLPAADLSHTLLHVDLRYFDERRQLTFDLFASSEARRHRKLEALDAVVARDLAARPEEPALWVRRGRAADARGAEEAALSHFAKARSLPGVSADAWLFAIDLLQRRGALEEALALQADLASRRPADAAAWFALGATQYGLDRLEEARASLGKALAREPGHGEARLLLGAVLLVLGRDAEALEVLGALPPGANRTRSLPLRLLARLRAGAPLPKELLAEAERVRGAAPRSVQARQAAILQDLPGAADGALKEKDPTTRARLRLMLGYAARRRGDERAARAHFTAVTEVEAPELLESRLAAAALAAGDEEDGR